MIESAHKSIADTLLLGPDQVEVISEYVGGGFGGDSMRAPGEAIGLLALEQAMDELAVALDMDPIALRLKNEPEQDPEKEMPFSTRALIPCLTEGARRFGSDKRPKQPGSTRDGKWLVGLGVAAAIRGNYLRKAAARATMRSAREAFVEMDMTDIGTGSYTVFAQIAAEMLGLPVGNIEVRLGHKFLSRHVGLGRLVRRLELRRRAPRCLHQAQGQARRG